MKTKKTQSSVEFLMIVVFGLTVISLVIYIIGVKLVDYQKQTNTNEINNFAQSILNEIKITDKMQEGFYRKIPVLNSNMKRFNLTINANKSYFSLTDIYFYDNPKLHTSYYEFQEGLNISLLNQSGNYSIVIYKPNVRNLTNTLII